jgi:flagellin
LGLAAGNVTATTPAVAATGSLGFSAIATAGEAVVVGGQTYTFRANNAGVTAAGDVSIGANATDSATNLAAAINAAAGGGASGSTFMAAAVANTNTASLTGSTLTVTAKTAGTAANGQTLTTTGGETVTAVAGGLAAVTATTAVTNDLSTAANSQATLGLVNAAIAGVASLRGTIGASINRLQAASNVESVQVQNLTAAEDNIMAANIPQQVTNLSEFSILNQSGISALAQANSAQQSILKLLQ